MLDPMSLRPSLFSCAALIALAFTTACGGSPSRRSEAPKPKPSASAPAEAEEPPIPEGALRRSHVDAVLKKGPPWLLSRVEVEEVLRKGAFIGWRVVNLPASWEGSGLRPGDVVTKVNGLGVEKPDDFFAVWTALSQAKELRVELERDGKVEALTMPIVGEPDANTKVALEREPEPAPPPGAPAPGQPPGIRGQTVIVSTGEDAF